MFTKRFIAFVFAAGAAAAVLFFVWFDDRREDATVEARPGWERGVPVTIGWSAGLRRFDNDIHAALMEIQRQVGCPVLSPSGTRGQVTMHMLNPNVCGGMENNLDVGDIAGTWVCPSGEVEIQYRDMADPSQRYPVILHELGHAMGLSHDDSGFSVMNDPPPPMLDGMPAPEFTSKDRKALRERYCR
jgi:hypothetical protein